jgi:hypothetical protein
MDDDDCRILPFRLSPTKIRRRAISAARDMDSCADAARLLSEFFEWLRDPLVAPEARAHRIRKLIEISFENATHWT